MREAAVVLDERELNLLVTALYLARQDPAWNALTRGELEHLEQKMRARRDAVRAPSSARPARRSD